MESNVESMNDATEHESSLDVMQDNNSELSTSNSSLSTSSPYSTEDDLDSDVSVMVGYDLDMPTRHSYLGDMDVIPGAGTSGQLPPGEVFSLVLYSLDRTVAFPGERVPVKLPLDCLKEVQDIIRQKKPLSRIFGMIYFAQPDADGYEMQIGCTAEIVQMNVESEGISLMTKLQQRFTYQMNAQATIDVARTVFWKGSVKIFDDERAMVIPKCVHEKFSFWPRWAYRPYNAKMLCKESIALYKELVPKHEFEGVDNPTAFSFWLASKLPMGCEIQYKLLCCNCTAIRLNILNFEMRQFSKDETFRCKICSLRLANTCNILSMSQEGASGLFVNSHGFLHDIVTLLAVKGIETYGQPEVEHSWFPGYAWTLAFCRGCGNHLGWKFTSASSSVNLEPGEFWGLRKDLLGSLGT